MCPHFKAALAHVRTTQGTRKLGKCFHTPVYLCFLTFLSQALSLTSLLFLSHSFHQLITTNYDLHLLIVQTLCLHSSRSTRLRKTFTVNHYFHIPYFNKNCQYKVSFSSQMFLSALHDVYSIQARY